MSGTLAGGSANFDVATTELCANVDDRSLPADQMKTAFCKVATDSMYVSRQFLSAV